MKRRRIIVTLLILALAPVVGLRIMSAMSERPNNLGVDDGKLLSCPSTPNCVSTQADDETHRMDAIPYEGSKQSILQRIKDVVTAMPRTQIVSDEGSYLYVEFTSRIFRFVDDVEFYIDDDAKLIHFRSASRIGKSDLGANRKRMNQISDAIKNR